MCRRYVLLSILATVVLGLFGASDGGAATELKGFRVGVDKDRTRFVVDVGASVEYQVFTLSDPYRMVIDLPELEPVAGLKATGGKTGLIKKYRYGLFKPGNFRVVLDLNGPARLAKSFHLPASGKASHRLVLDLKPVDRATFLRTANVVRPWTKGGGAKPSAAPPKVRSAPSAKDKIVVVIDPGHGGVDPGTISKSGRREKAVTLEVSRVLKKELEKRGRYVVKLTRTRDIFRRLRDRVRYGRDNEADLFISIHADSIDNRRVRGATVYTLSQKSSDREAAALAKKENRVDIIAGVDLTGESNEVTSILIDLAQRESMNYSAIFANMLVPEIAKRNVVRRNAHRFAGFAVLKAPDIPSVLVELGYLSNRQDEKLLSSKSGQASLAQSIARAVDRYFDSRAE
jgi:N-acetylmuramoyl-L-alanine amidase